jgi:hypothetical protein
VTVTKLRRLFAEVIGKLDWYCICSRYYLKLFATLATMAFIQLHIIFLVPINHDIKNLIYLSAGITTGMFGSAVEITLPKLIDMLFIFVGILTTMLALCWRKCRPYRVSFRTLINQTRRRFEYRSGRIESENSVPIQILVSSRTNLVTDHLG